MISRREFLIGSATSLGTAVFPSQPYASADNIRIVYSTSFVPLSYLDDNNQMVGFYVDLFDFILSEKMGFSVEHIGLPWKRAQRTVELDNAEALCSNATSKRREYINFCEEPIIENRKVAIFKRGGILDNKKNLVFHLDELKSLQHVSYLGNGWAKSHLKGFNIEWASNSTLPLTMIAKDHGQVFITGEYQARYRIKKLKLSDKLLYNPVQIKQRSLHKFGLRKTFPDSEKVIGIFTKHLNKMRETSEFDELFSQYI
jgi:hypothetical protein